MLDAFLKDLRHSLRMFTQSPAFSLAAVAALTLGIGANTAIFSVVNAVLLKPVSLADPDRLVLFMTTSPGGSGSGGSPAKFQHYRAQEAVAEHVAAFRLGVVNYTGGTFPEQLRMGQASSEFFTLVGAPLLRGRGFTRAEDTPDGVRVAVVEPDVLELPFQPRRRHHRPLSLAWRRALHHRRRARRSRSGRLRADAASLDAVPVA